VPTDAAAAIPLCPGVAEAVSKTRLSPEFIKLRQSLEALESSPDSTLLTESHFRHAWRRLCQVHAEHAAVVSTRAFGHPMTTWAVVIYLLGRVVAWHIEPRGKLDWGPLVDVAASQAIERFSPKILNAFRAVVKVPFLQHRYEMATMVRCSKVPLSIK